MPGYGTGIDPMTYATCVLACIGIHNIPRFVSFFFDYWSIIDYYATNAEKNCICESFAACVVGDDHYNEYDNYQSALWDCCIGGDDSGGFFGNYGTGKNPWSGLTDCIESKIGDVV